MITPKITVVLGAFNQRDILEVVLPEYDNQSLDNELFEVVVVDSSSSDGTDKFFKSFKPEFNFRGIIQENKGKSSARNRGVNEASSTYIIITDADMIPHRDFLKHHLEAQENTTKPTCFEGVTMNMTKLHWPVEESLLYPYIKANYRDKQKLGWYYFLTGNISFPKHIFTRFKGFDEDFGGYGWEDLELGYRMSRENIPLIFLKHAVNYHYHVISEEGEIMRNIKKGESAQIFLKKHPRLKWFLGLNPFSVFLRKRLHDEHLLVKIMSRLAIGSSNTVKTKFSKWFMKEYNYLSGILSLPPCDIEKIKQKK